MMKLANDNHVVMVDDNEGDIVLAKVCFERSKLTNPWLAFPSGEKLLDHLAGVKAGAEPMPAIVLLDINMPQMSGFEVLTEIRKDSFFCDLPIFCMLTSSAAERDVEKARKLGASGFVTKPGNLNDYVGFFDSLARE
jgi:two-component system response regulator